MQKYFVLLAAAAFMACQGNQSTNSSDTATGKMQEGVEQIRQGVEMEADSAGAYLKEQKDKAAKAIEERRAELDARIEELKKDGSAKSEKARKKLEAVRDDLGKKLEDVRNSTAETWDSTKRGIDETMKKADAEWQEFKKDFKELFQ